MMSQLSTRKVWVEETHHAIALIDTVHMNFCSKPDSWRFLGIIRSAFDTQVINPRFKRSLNNKLKFHGAKSTTDVVINLPWEGR